MECEGEMDDEVAGEDVEVEVEVGDEVKGDNEIGGQDVQVEVQVCDEVEVEGDNEVAGENVEVEVEVGDQVEVEGDNEVVDEDEVVNYDEIASSSNSEGGGVEELRAGLVDVHVNVVSGVHNIIEGIVEVEMGLNEEKSDEADNELVRGRHTQPKSFDRGLSDDQWESNDLVSLEDSENDGEGHEVASCGPFGTFVMPKSMAGYKWEVGTTFTNQHQFKEAIRTCVVDAGRNLKFVKNDNRRVRVKCIGSQGQCTRTTFCAYLVSCNTWQLRKIVDVHTCSKEFNIKIINLKWLSDSLGTSLQENSDLKINDIRVKAVMKWNTNVSVSMARRARVKASILVEGSFKDQFRRIYDYAHELLRSNLGSIIKVKVDDVDGDIGKRRGTMWW